MKGILKWPLIAAAVVIILRVIAEQAGASEAFNNILSAVALHLVIAPIYFAVLIGKSAVPRAYTTLLKYIFLYVVLVRVMVLPTYWLARVYEWPQPRFAGLSGPDVTAFTGYVAIPVITGVIWVVVSVIFGGLIGSIVLAATRRLLRTESTGKLSRP